MKHKPMVHIVDDDSALRKALCFLMESENIPAQAYCSAEDFLDKHAQSKLGCLLLDVRMPGMNGLKLLELLNKQHIKLPVIIITGHGDVALAVDAMKAGALDFIEKPFDNEQMLSVVRNCLKQCVSLEKTTQIKNEIEARFALLTKREKEVMNHLVAGKQNKTIAQQLGVSSRTIEIHRARVMEKLGASSLSDVVRTVLLYNNEI